MLFINTLIMGAGILNLVTNNGVQNRWINQDPQITFFKKIYRRHTPFATETIPLSFNSKLDFGGSANVTLLPHGDLAHRMFFMFDIPKLAAVFLKSKTKDISQMINSITITDTEFYSLIKKFAIDEEQVELDQIFNLVDDQLNKYDIEQQSRLNILEMLENYKYRTGTRNILGYQGQNFHISNSFMDSESFSRFNNEDKYNAVLDVSELDNDYIQFKIDLSDQWISQKKEYFLINEIIKLIYFSEKPIINIIPLINDTTVPKNLINDYIFDELIPNKEIFLSFCLNYMQVEKKNMNSLDTINIQLLQHVSHSDLTTTDTYCFLKNIVDSRDKIEDNFYAFGPEFYYMLNSYNAIINVVDSLGTTVPIVVSKVYKLVNRQYNIYTNNVPAAINETYFPTAIDPNFKANFLMKVNNPGKPIENSFFVPIDFTNINDKMYPNRHVNSYTNLFNNQANIMFNNLQKSMDILFETYRVTLFCSTNKLFFNNSPTLSNIYSYLVPTDKFNDDSCLRISNVFNVNIWFFYFFKYLDMLDISSFTYYVKDHIITTMTVSGMLFMKGLMTLLKINIEYYMNEISYLLNDLYASSPSTSPLDNMKNYIPTCHNTIVNGINICDDLIAITIIFHRNHVPTILEIFQFIYHFITMIDTDRINKYLDLAIPEIEAGEMFKIRSIVRLFYYQIFGHFMNVYDDFHFEPAANFSTNEFDENENDMVKQYVQYFLNGTELKCSKWKKHQMHQYEQPVLLAVLQQMEFYFISEMLHMRELQKLYHDVLFNKQLIEQSVGSTTADIIEFINNILKNTTNCDVVSEKINSTNVDRVRKYWDEIFSGHSMQNNIYYGTFDIDRYRGKSYLKTSYKSRNFGLVDKPMVPIPLPPTNPHGINDNYYNHNQVITDYVPLPVTNNNIVETNIPVYWNYGEYCGNPVTYTTSYHTNTDGINNNNNFKLYTIDYFRIKHKIFRKHGFHSSPPDVKFVDEYQFNLLQLVKLTERINNYSTYDKYIFNCLLDTVFHLIKYTVESNISDVLDGYLFGIEESIELEENTMTKNYLAEMVIFVKELYDRFNNGEQICLLNSDSQQYTASDLITVNNYVKQILKNPAPNYIIDKLLVLRDSYISQYFYCTKYQDSINQIFRLGEISDSFIFKNISQISYEILRHINFNGTDLSIMEKMSPMLILYPDLHSKQIRKMSSLQNTLDDFSQGIFKYFNSFLNTNSPSRLTFKDIYDLINCIFMSIKQIYQYSIEHNYYDYIINKLEIYQPILLDKLSLLNEINSYLLNRIILTDIDVSKIAKMAETYQINYNDYYGYIRTKIVPLYNNNKTQKFLIWNTIISDIDYYFLKWRSLGKNILDDDCCCTIKKYIMEDIFIDNEDDMKSIFYQYFSLVGNEYYSLIYFFMNYAQKNCLEFSMIINPLIYYGQTHLIQDQEHIMLQYNSFSKISDVLEYFMDYIWDCSMTNCHKSPLVNENLLEYPIRFSLINNIIRMDSEKNDFNHIYGNRVHAIIEALNKINSSKDFSDPVSAKTTNYKLDTRNKIINLSKDIVQKGIFMADKQSKEIIMLRNKLLNILYRNKKAKAAWVRKLGHFIIKEVTCKFSDQVCDHHISDWLEVSHEISKDPNTDSGYNKMIGHREDLIIFDDKVKESYTIIVPFIFYFNKNIALSIPLNASINTRYEINIILRSLTEISYKEEFSDFIDINTPNQPHVCIPSINNTYLMVEYIYLSTEERKIFATNKLEYLTTELQYDNTANIVDSVLLPIYKVGTIKKTFSRIKDGKKIKEQYYDRSKTVYLDQNEINALMFGDNALMFGDNPDLISRDDYQLQSYMDRTGISKTMMTYNPISEINQYIHKKRIIKENHFNHPNHLFYFSLIHNAIFLL